MNIGKLAGNLITAMRLAVSPPIWRSTATGLRTGGYDPNGKPSTPYPILEVDPAAGLSLLEIDGKAYWEASGLDHDGLRAIHAEVFDRESSHHYEVGGCAIRPDDVVIDAGACEGFFTRFALDRGARVVAVEPWSTQANALRRTFAREIDEGRVRIEQRALSDREGSLELRIDPAHPWGATLGSAYNATVGEVVPLTTLDRLVDATWGRCDFLKADIEGAEVAMVDGAVRTLARDRPRISIAVYHRSTNYLDIRRKLRSLRIGYHVEGKGAQRRDIFYIPVMLHAWTGPAA